LFFKSKAMKDLASLPDYVNNVADFFLLINDNLIPFSFILIGYYLLPKEKRPLTSLWRGRNYSLEANRLFLIGMLFVGNIAIASISAPHFFRYLLGMIPFSLMCSAFIACKLCEEKKVWGVLVVAVLLFTDLFTFPIKVLNVPNYTMSEDQKRFFMPSLARARFPFFEYLQMILYPSKDPNRSIVEFLRGHAKAGEMVLAGTSDHTIKYYLPQLKVIGALDGADLKKEKADEAKWLIPRSISAYTDPGITEYARQLLNENSYERFDLGLVDHYENMPEPEGLILNWNKTPFTAHVEIFKKRDLSVEDNQWKGTPS